MITVNPSNVLNLLWRHFDEYKATSVVTEREKSLSNVILSLIESTMVSSSPLPCILKYVAAHHSSDTSTSTFSPGLSSSPSSSSSYIDCNNFGYNNSSKVKDTPAAAVTAASSSSSFRSNITRTDSVLHSNAKSSSTLTSSSGAIISGNKARPAKPARRSRVSPIQYPSHQSTTSSTTCNNHSVSVKSIGSSIHGHRKHSADVSSGHPLLTRGDSDLVRGVTTIPVPIPPSSTSSSRFGGMFSINKSRSMAVLPTNENACGQENVASSPRMHIFTRNNTSGSSVASTSSSFRVSHKPGGRFSSSINNGAFNRNYNGPSMINGNKEKNGSKEVTRCTSQQQQSQQQSQVSSSSSVSSYSINGKNQPFSYSQPNATVSSVTSKLNTPSTGKVSSSTPSNNVTSSTAVAAVTSGNGGDVNCNNNGLTSLHSNAGHTGVTREHRDSIRGTAGTPDTTVSIDSMAKKKKIRQRLLLFLRKLLMSYLVINTTNVSLLFVIHRSPSND